MATKTRSPRSGFTLVEMLVVVAIIGILAAMVTAGVYKAVAAGKKSRIAQELGQLHDAVQSYHSKYSDFPPNFDDPDVVKRHLRKLFPRHQDGNGTTNALTDLCSAQLTPPEALVFWLSQLSNDHKHPLTSRDTTGSTRPKDPILQFTFDESRLVATRQITVGSEKLQLYVYTPRDGKGAPYVYFENRDYASASYAVKDSSGNTLETVKPYKSSATGTTEWANKANFQLISAGLDGEFGNTGSNYKVFPKGDYYDLPKDLDNIANFSDGKAFEDHME